MNVLFIQPLRFEFLLTHPRVQVKVISNPSDPKDPSLYNWSLRKILFCTGIQGPLIKI